MTPHYADDTVTLHAGDCLDVLRGLPDASVDSVCTDPPYGLEFMGKDWDRFGTDTGNGYREKPRMNTAEGFGGYKERPNFYTAGHPFQQWCQLWAAECLRVLKPGGHLLAFGGTRTFHRLACAVEDAGFEVRDSIAWLYGSGFPKSLDVSKAIDKAAGAEREVKPWHPKVGRGVTTEGSAGMTGNLQCPICEKWKFAPDHCTCPKDNGPQTDAARTWQGWGSAMKPAFEPVVVARKPLIGTIAQNVLAHGTGALNIDGCRIGEDGGGTRCGNRDSRGECVGHPAANGSLGGGVMRHGPDASGGRWPANVILDESQAEVLDEQSGTSQSRVGKPRGAESGDGWGMTATGAEYDDAGGASRFFYTAKAASDERVRVNGVAHPTVKPLSLMRWLVRLVTPPGGVVLEPFAGSGTTLEACILEGFRCIAVEREADYLPLIVQRINRRRDPVAAVLAAGDDGGLFDLFGEVPA